MTLRGGIANRALAFVSSWICNVCDGRLRDRLCHLTVLAQACYLS
ncbi:hypothetical protein [Nostoc sp. MG11]|nr:hypothetical protein [Nostoc sp. MG11]